MTRRDGRTRSRRNTSLGLVFGALVGALFLSVLLVITVWSLDPVIGAIVVSALPAATLAVRPLARRSTRVRRARRRGLLAGASSRSRSCRGSRTSSWRSRSRSVERASGSPSRR